MGQVLQLHDGTKAVEECSRTYRIYLGWRGRLPSGIQWMLHMAGQALGPGKS